MFTSSKAQSNRLALFSLALAGLAAAAVLWHPASVSAAAGGVDPASPEFYTQNVQPILKSNCYRCHAGMNHRGGLKMDNPSSLMRGGKSGADIKPGDPEHSLLITLINHAGPSDDPKPMPPKSKLSGSDIATITEWVKAGAAMPAEAQ
jgi:hypothetical protein